MRGREDKVYERKGKCMRGREDKVYERMGWRSV
jgi:hypothetical protein